MRLASDVDLVAAMRLGPPRVLTFGGGDWTSTGKAMKPSLAVGSDTAGAYPIDRKESVHNLIGYFFLELALPASFD